jgi:pimeloyl-ACP methyl ester carboxylesterase
MLLMTSGSANELERDSKQRFVEKLLKRRVIQAGAVYVAVAWGAVEILLTMQEQLGWADWLPKAVLALFAVGFPVVIIWSWLQDLARAPDHPSSYKQGEIHFVTAKDNVRLAYAMTGEGPAIVKAAHWLTSLDLDWQSVISRHLLSSLSDGHQLLRYDQRGCGLSDRGPDDLGLDTMVGDLECIVDAAGFQKFALFGPSQGGPVAISYAVKHPEKVSALILYGSYSQGFARRGDPAVAESGQAMIELVRLGWGQDNPAFRQMFGSLFIPDANEEQREAFDYMQRESATAELAARLMRALSEFDVSNLLPQLSVPVLVLHARGDARIPYELGRALASGIPNAEFQSLDSGNHIMMEDEPAFPILVSTIEDFLQRHPV